MKKINKSHKILLLLLATTFCIQNSYSQTTYTATTYSSSNTNVKKSNRGLTTYSSSSSSISYSTTVEAKVYNDHGENTFSRSKLSFFSSIDSYPLTMAFLTKKMPFYTK